jgi:hypothetical protein
LLAVLELKVANPDVHKLPAADSQQSEAYSACRAASALEAM